jgi:hypothetical protein
MAKILRFTLPKRSSPMGVSVSGSTIVDFSSMKRNAVVNRSGDTVALRFPKAWLPFVRWPNATSSNRR